VTKHEGRITYSTRVHLISSTLDACVVVVERNMMHYNVLQGGIESFTNILASKIVWRS